MRGNKQQREARASSEIGSTTSNMLGQNSERVGVVTHELDLNEGRSESSVHDIGEEQKSLKASRTRPSSSSTSSAF